MRAGFTAGPEPICSHTRVRAVSAHLPGTSTLDIHTCASKPKPWLHTLKWFNEAARTIFQLSEPRRCVLHTNNTPWTLTAFRDACTRSPR